MGFNTASKLRLFPVANGPVCGCPETVAGGEGTMSGVTLQLASQAPARQETATSSARDFVTQEESRDAKFISFRPDAFLKGTATHMSNTRATCARNQSASNGYGRRGKFPAEDSSRAVAAAQHASCAI
jgi:hypothetical protein